MSDRERRDPTPLGERGCASLWFARHRPFAAEAPEPVVLALPPGTKRAATVIAAPETGDRAASGVSSAIGE